MGRLDFILSIMKRTKPKLKVLVLCDGAGCFSKMSKSMGHDVRTLDILPLEHIDYQMDIMDFEPKVLNGWVPDVIEISVPCETFSGITHMKGGGNLYYQAIYEYSKKGRKLRVTGITARTDFTIDKRLIKKDQKKIRAKQLQHLAYVTKSIELIKQFKAINPNVVFLIENPATGYIRYIIQPLLDCIENKTTYCMYGSKFRKETSIFSNVELSLKYCPKHKDGVVDLCGGHTDGFVQRYDNKRQAKGVVQKSSYLERSSIPDKLCLDILTQVNTKMKGISV